MKKIIALLVTSMLLTSLSFGQKMVTTYYDYKHTEKKEVYSTNDYGVKNGTYTKYSEYGGVLIQGTYKKDMKEGLWVEKDEKGNLVSKETYLDNVLNGPASYYNLFSLGSGVPQTSGTFKAGMKEGVWSIIDRLKSKEYEYYYEGVDFSNEVGCEDIKHNVLYKNDVEIIKNGKSVYTFYPSGKIYAEFIVQRMAGVGEDFFTTGLIYDGSIIPQYGINMRQYIYYPNGKLYSLCATDSTAKTIIDKKWLYPEGGNKDSIPSYMNAAIIQGQVAKAKGHIADSIKQVNAYHNYFTDKNEANALSVNFKTLDEASQKYSVVLNDISQSSPLYKIPESSKDSIVSILNELKYFAWPQAWLNDQITGEIALHEKFVELYTSKQEMANYRTGANDSYTTYPHGEHLYEKTDKVLKQLLTDVKEGQATLDERYKKANLILSILNKLISLANTDTKDIDKQMKKAETIDDIRGILGV